MILTTTNKELQQLIRKIKFVRRSISILSRQIDPFMSLVKIKSDTEFSWGPNQQKAFEGIKQYLSKQPVLVTPQPNKLCYVYLSVGDSSIALVLVQIHDSQKRVVSTLAGKC
jgi:hypothetical protein